MKIKIKLYASLQDYLPAGAKDQAADIDVPDAATPSRVMLQLGLPKEMCHLVILNGVYVAPEARDTQAMEDGDTLAIWPPVAGG